MVGFMANAKTWAERIGEWQESGLNAVKFTEGRDFSAHQLCYWAAKMRRAKEGHDGATSGPARSVAVRLARVLRVATRAPAAGPTVAPLTVELFGIRVVVPQGFDRATFSVVLDEIEARGARAGGR
jgi:hypothetical protein